MTPKALSNSGPKGCCAVSRLLQGWLDVPSSGFRPTGPCDPLWKPQKRPTDRRRPRPTLRPRVPKRSGRTEALPIAAARCPGPATECPEPSPEGPRAGGRFYPGRAAASPARTSATVSPPRTKQRAAAGVPRKARPATGIGALAARLSGGVGRRTHRAPAGGPRQVLAPPGRRTPLPPLPGDSAQSHRQA